DLSAVARSLQNETGTQATLEMAVRAATSIIEGCDLAGVSIAGPGGVRTRAASDDAVLAMHALQDELQQGPAVDALRDHETVYAPDLLGDERWPRWGPRVHEIGVRSVLSYRLFTTRDTLGAFDLFSRTGDAFDHDAIDNALALAAHVAVAVAAELKDEHLQVAVTTRTVIGQAQGILMERFDLSADRAFEVLVRLSSHQNVKLHRVASQLVETRTIPSS
uniref:GAF and ANTAR domain-containing protein n=1 Tax=Ornithinimicrobium cerasi TaxID=2248773 RepID=UPI001F291CB7